MNNKKLITIIPGSYKPPHKGHLSLIENLIKQNSKFSNKPKIVIIISKKPRTLDKRLQFYEKKSKDDLQKILIEIFPKDKNILEMTKEELLNKIEYSIIKNKIPTINAKQSFKVWNIYIEYLKDKYKKLIEKKQFPDIIIKISDTNNIIQDTSRLVLKLLRENRPEKIILMKSEKNKNNKRFNFLLKGSLAKYLDVLIFPNIKDIDARNMRDAILNNDLHKFNEYLPKELSEIDKKKIWKIVHTI